MCRSALGHARPRPDLAGAVLAVGGVLRRPRRTDPDGDRLPVRLVGLPEPFAGRAPVVELVEDPVPEEIPGRLREPGGRGRAGRDVDHAAVHDRLVALDQLGGALVALVAALQGTGKVEAV